MPASAVIGGVAGREEQFVCNCGDLFGGVGNSFDIGKIDGRFNLVNERFKRFF